MRQAIDILNRRRWVFIIPFSIVFVLPLLWSLVFMRTYESNALVWLEDDVSIAQALNDDQAAAQQQGGTPIEGEAQTLQQLLQSRTFLESVISRTPLQAKMGTPVGREKTIANVKRNLAVATVGPNSLKITFYGRSPEQAVTVVNATTSTFMNWVNTSVKEQNQKAVNFFLKQSEEYQGDLNLAASKLRRYKEQHPETEQLEQRDKVLEQMNITATPAVQSEFAKLKSQNDYAQKLYDASLIDLAKTRVRASAQEQKYVTGLRIVDEPIPPTGFSRKRMLLTGFLSFMAALIIGVLAVLLAEITDRTFRSERDVKDVLNLPVLVEIKQTDQNARQA